MCDNNEKAPSAWHVLSELSYTAASPDERELVQAAAKLGVALVHRRGKAAVSPVFSLPTDPLFAPS